MFDLPDAKRVRRSDLYTRSSSSSPEPPSPIDPDISARFHNQLASLYGPISFQSCATGNASNPESINDAPHSPPLGDNQDQAEEFDFRLFSNVQEGKIVLKEEAIDKGIFVVQERDKSYYFTGPIEGQRKEKYAIAAISGENILEGRGKRYWGLEVPWRVRVVKIGVGGQKKLGSNGLLGARNSSNVEKRRKLGKKKRILMRERRRAIEAQEQAMTREKESKEEADKERRARKNREKKVKRKAKEKALKAAAGGIDQTEPGVDGADE
ncbi:uncharacterized protein EAE97_000315 [Botrytis byssoidea]|uniref:Uncharacterized protein n=1 Tax=Botrytis byssoidea TaxID=139641 RepID=A0A9P5IYX7_9HELO|nr:uncharacterized protein EAE97_000315 [Botrytis byssoidea]KAF7955056.1 hypothetical protein EAE97_000315 [Botrytis byssoidea]